MMKIIFDRETEVGRCNCEPTSDDFLYAEPHFSTMYAHTQASLNKTGLLKIEQHCYFRDGSELPDQPWVRPQITLEPALETEEATVELVKIMHEQFIDRTRKQFPQRCVA
jgi:hypothetical protein